MNKDLFKKVYRDELLKAHTKNPKDYSWSLNEFDEVLKRMYSAIDRLSFNKDSAAFRSTCKALGIRHTYNDIERFLNEKKNERVNIFVETLHNAGCELVSYGLAPKPFGFCYENVEETASKETLKQIEEELDIIESCPSMTNELRKYLCKGMKNEIRNF